MRRAGQHDFSAYDLVISSSQAVANGVLTSPNELHLSYVHTPARYAWDLQGQCLNASGITREIRGSLARIILHYFRLWDLCAASRVDSFVANSRFVAARIDKIYRRDAQVIYPPVDVDRLQVRDVKDDFYLTVARLVPYKRVDLLVEAFGKMAAA